MGIGWAAGPWPWTDHFLALVLAHRHRLREMSTASCTKPTCSADLEDHPEPVTTAGLGTYMSYVRFCRYDPLQTTCMRFGQRGGVQQPCCGLGHGAWAHGGQPPLRPSNGNGAVLRLMIDAGWCCL